MRVTHRENYDVRWRDIVHRSQAHFPHVEIAPEAVRHQPPPEPGADRGTWTSAKIVERSLAVNVVNVVESNRHEDPRAAEPGDGWLADDALFPPRPPIRSHRAPHPRRRRWRLTALALMLPVAAFGSRALAQPVGSQPAWVPEVTTSSPYDPTVQRAPATRPPNPGGPAAKPLEMPEVNTAVPWRR
jgi:hypothetical protein